MALISGENSSLAAMRKKLAAIKKLPQGEEPDLDEKDQKIRRDKLQVLVAQLRRKKNVQNTQLKRWLTTDEYAEIENQWQSQLEIRQQLKDKPAEIVEYEKQLRKALLFENRANAGQHRGTKAGSGFSRKAEACYESAIEHLEESLSTNPSLAMWLDRQPDFSAGGNISFESGGVPLVATSRSISKQGSGMFMGKKSKLEVKIDVVERAIDAIR